MKTIRNIYLAFRAHSVTSLVLAGFALMWSSVALAATALAAHVQAQDLQVDPMLLLLACFVSTLAGGTTLAIRVNDMLMADAQPRAVPKPWLLAAGHMGGSWLGGSVGLFTARASEWGVWTLLLAVLFMSFLGSKGVESAAKKWLGTQVDEKP